MLRKRIQLGLLHVAVAMTLVPINGTLNRVMIKELELSATLVALLASLPYLFSPVQVAIGSFSDRNPILGYRRSPYIAFGLLLCALGVFFSPRAAFLLYDNFWLGIGAAVLIFGAWGMGFNFASVSYFSLASELSGPRGRSRTISIMFFMMVVSIIGTSVGLSRLLKNFSPEALTAAFNVVGGAALAIGVLGLLALEPRQQASTEGVEERHTLRRLIDVVLGTRQARLFFWYLILMLAAILGQDVLLEPFAGEAFGMPVDETTMITSIWGANMLVSLVIAGILEGRVAKRTIAVIGAWGGIAAFSMIAASGLISHTVLFYAGVVLLGLATGLATVSNLSLMLDMTVAEKVGLFIGAWGMANAFSRLTGSMMSGVVRDVISGLVQDPVIGYVVVFGIEAAMLLISLVLLRRIDVSAFRRQTDSPSIVERAAVASEA